jgi:hypothetical protein
VGDPDGGGVDDLDLIQVLVAEGVRAGPSLVVEGVVRVPVALDVELDRLGVDRRAVVELSTTPQKTCIG